ncbi:TIGR02597 family protein [Rubritalea squalenifaciens DSM 18772]|uniref:TIGR02597 family protein n=1 Tax=Rubritalea squalenifaciens DSM 18772 TaxID=1123071 RepID=A0A1M6PH68_9BACT|nr:TIGR02597 family protein [Rubritalea squalenifaciens]SHK07237.1 TIGR02597 family protein [Rubritalea squalenifaciens DSM 18772]
MKKTILTLSSVLGLTFMAHGQATTAAVGYNTVTCLPNSDTIVSVPFLNTTDSISTTVSGSPSGSGSSATFTMANVSGLTTDQYSNLYYVRFTSGQLEGEIYQITGNTATTVTIDTLDASGATRTMIEDGNKFTIYKFWTLGTLFPPSTQATLVPAPSVFAGTANSSIQLPDFDAIGTNKNPKRKFYIFNDQWNEVGKSGSANDTILWPDRHFIIRHTAGVTNPTTYRPTGTVMFGDSVIPLSVNDTSSQDNFVAIPRPIDVKIKDLGFITSGAEKNFEPRDSGFDGIFDQIFVFDNSDPNTQNRNPESRYYFDGPTQTWKKFVSSGDSGDVGDEVISPSQGIVIRKAKGTNGVVFWTNPSTYNN